MRVGVVVPVFTRDPELPLAVARRAEFLGIDGVFVLDHLFPAGQPQRPALHGPTVLGALASVTSRVRLGTLVARVTLLAQDDLVALFENLQSLSGGRIIAGLGMGDAMGKPENDAYGIEFPPPEDRAGRLRQAAAAVQSLGISVWIGGRSAAAHAVARDHGDAWNLWGVDAKQVAGTVRDHAGSPLEITWAGPCLVATDDEAFEEKRRLRPTLGQPGAPGGRGPSGPIGVVAEHARQLRDAGASWVVYSPPDLERDPSVIDCLAEVAAQLR